MTDFTKQTHSEAPVSATARMISPSGVDWLLTIQDETVSGLMDKVDALEAHLFKRGWLATETAKAFRSTQSREQPTSEIVPERRNRRRSRRDT